MHLICCYSKLKPWLQEIFMQNSDLLQDNNKYGENYIRSKATLFPLTKEARTTRERAQLFRHDVLAWLPYFSSLSVSAQPTSASTNFSPYMSFHIFFGGKT